jgi:hypothetical protein
MDGDTGMKKQRRDEIATLILIGLLCLYVIILVVAFVLGVV